MWERKSWMYWYYRSMLLFVLPRKKCRWGGMDQNDPGNTITAQARNETISLSAEDCVNEL